MKNQKSIWNKEYKANITKWHKETVSLPEISKNSLVLELGVGNGKTLKAILKQKPKEVVAIDFSIQAIEISKSNKIFKSVKFIKSDVKSLPFKNNHFDTVVCYYILNNMTKKDRQIAVNEIYRVLKPKGNLIFEDFAVVDFRQKDTQKTVETNTIQNKKGIICHFFKKTEIVLLFHNFSKIKITLKTTHPITHKPTLKRKIIQARLIK